MVRLPDQTHRMTINGRTGTGKTQFAAWVLSKSPFDRIPYVIMDFKREKLLNSIHRAKYLDLTEKLPKERGIYILQPSFGDDDAIERWFWRVHSREKIGLFIDEGYMLPVRKALRVLLTQGRSKHIPMIILSQRPSGVSPFIYSEADFHCCFPLNDIDDVKTVQRRTPRDFLLHPAWDPERKLLPFQSRWYDVANDYSTIFNPVPSADRILEEFERRLKPKRKWI